MYTPPKFRAEKSNEATELMDQYPFAMVISHTGAQPFISHLPLTVEHAGDKLVLIGHLARANPHWKLLSRHPVTVVFQGAHTFITPKWYAENDVPTWNYSVAHVTGRVELIESFEGIMDCLKKLTKHVERHWPSGWDFYIPDDLTDPKALSRNIVGFRIHVDEINFKKKLSQNRSAADREGVLKGLRARTDDNSRSVLADMLKLYREDGELRG